MGKFSKSFIIVIAIIGVAPRVHAQTAESFLSTLNVPAMFSRDVAHMYNQSATFRAQCDRLAQAQNIRVSIQADLHIPRSCRAYTIIRRTRGMLCAEVHLPVSLAFAELIAHEFEHIIEQLEHVNLPKLSMVRGSGVSQVGFELFETERAQLAGTIVAQELRAKQLPAASSQLPQPPAASSQLPARSDAGSW